MTGQTQKRRFHGCSSLDVERLNVCKPVIKPSLQISWLQFRYKKLDASGEFSGPSESAALISEKPAQQEFKHHPKLIRCA
jgi:hypothetical protein